MFKKIDTLLTKIEPPNWVLFIIAASAILRIPSLFEPYYYGDEMIYLTLGNAIRKGLTLYSQIHDNKPPLLYLTAALAGNLVWFKAILALWMFVTIIIFWHLVKNLFERNVNAQKISVIIFAALTTLPIFEGNIVNAELFLIGPIILGILLLLKSPTNRNIFIAGIAFSIAALFKIPAIFDIPVVIIFWLITLKTEKDLPKIIKRVFILSLGVILPILVTFIYFFFKGALPDYFKAAFLQNVGYLSTWNTSQSGSFVVKHGPLLIRAGVVCLGLILMRIKSTKLSKAFLIATIWLLTSLFAATLSERPYPHYLIQAVPSISLLIGILISSPRFEQVLVIFPLSLALIVPVYYNFYYYSTTAYYERFALILKGNESKETYFNSFDKYTFANYKVSQFLMTTVDPKERIFVWGDSAPIIYALSRRLPSIKYTATYHIDSFSTRDQVIKDLSLNSPQFIVIPPNSPSFPDLHSLVNKKYVLVYTNYDFEVWQLL